MEILSYRLQCCCLLCETRTVVHAVLEEMKMWTISRKAQITRPVSLASRSSPDAAMDSTKKQEDTLQKTDKQQDDDDDSPPRMMDPSQNEKKYFYKVSIWGQMVDEDIAEEPVGRCICGLCVFCPFMLLILPISIATIIGLWALVQGMSYSAITMLPTTSVTVLSSLLLILCAIMFLFIIISIIIIRYSGTNIRVGKDGAICGICVVPFCGCFPYGLLVTTFGIAAAVLTSQLLDPTQVSANTTFSNYLNDQHVQETWNTAQHNLKCCGVMVFSDYQDIFNNLSVPLSCCNIDNPLVNETTCPVIVSNALHANQTGLIFSEDVFLSWSQCFDTFLEYLLELLLFLDCGSLP